MVKPLKSRNMEKKNVEIIETTEAENFQQFSLGECKRKKINSSEFV